MSLVNLFHDRRYKNAERFSSEQFRALGPGSVVTVGWKADGAPDWEEITISSRRGNRFTGYSERYDKQISFSTGNISLIEGKMPSGSESTISSNSLLQWGILLGAGYLLWKATR